MVARILRTTSLLNVLALGTFDVSAEEAEELDHIVSSTSTPSGRSEVSG